MSFDDINREVQSAGGNWVKLTKQSHGVLKGKILNAEVRTKMYNGKPVVSAAGNERKEWVFTLDVEGESKKWAAVESAQGAIRAALNGAKLEPGGFLQVAVVEDSVQGQKSAEYKAKYTPPVAEDPFAGGSDVDSDDSPF